MRIFAGGIWRERRLFFLIIYIYVYVHIHFCFLFFVGWPVDIRHWYLVTRSDCICSRTPLLECLPIGRISQMSKKKSAAYIFHRKFRDDLTFEKLLLLARKKTIIFRCIPLLEYLLTCRISQKLTKKAFTQ